MIGAYEEEVEMNKTEMIEHIATVADISKAKAALALEAFIEGVTTSLQTVSYTHLTLPTIRLV